MRLKVVTFTIGAGFVVGILAYLLGEIVALKAETQALLSVSVPVRPVRTKPEEPIEIADIMDKLQRHSTKLYFSGRHDNWPLAAFYLEEVGEVVESIAHKNVMEGQINISGLMQGLLLPEVEKLEAAVKSKDRESFQVHYRALTAACNQCHVASNHPFIIIQEPTAPGIDNQRYDLPKVIAAK